ncbi:MAG: hypothetical protein NTW25_12645 [Candidatus Kapabacteria bacterium]|nr:hypothetical protein [Candidatus Kapabacteria bacterium]
MILRYKVLLLIMAFHYSNLFSQDSQFIIRQFTKEISFVNMDTAQYEQTTVIEYPNYLALIEVPMYKDGGNKSKNLSEDIPKTEKFINFLNLKFNNKPVKFIFSSHWHLHSLSGITPFFKQGAKLVTTFKNWDYALSNGLLGVRDSNKYNNQVIFVKADTILLQDTKNPIQAIYLDSTYRHKPTKDYLFFYLKATKMLHSSCMCALDDKDLSKTNDMLFSDRLSDLDKAINIRKLDIDTLIKLGNYYDHQKVDYLPPVYSYNYFKEYLKHGKPFYSIIEDFAFQKIDFFIDKRDSIITNSIANKRNPNMFNSAVYECIRNKEYRKAIVIAQLLNLIFPNEISYLDTMGEAFYAYGDITSAKYYDAIIKKKDPNFTSGLKTWETNKLNNSY